MRKKFPCLLFAILPLAAFSQRVDPDHQLHVASQHLDNALKANQYAFLYPRSTKEDGSIKLVESRDWTSGFFVGNLWQIYEYTKDEKWMAAARKWNVGLEKEKTNTRTHDLGFMLYCSFGNGFRLTQDGAYREILLQGARSLSKRFNVKTGCIKSWDHGKWQFPVIIDNMMNLELLFWATKVSGDSSFYKIAVTHANTTLKNHFHEDYSSYHVVDYDTLTGNVIEKVTHQGFANESAWARGQSWALYGYTVAYRETKDLRYLRRAEGIADFILTNPNLPKDKVPYWDYNVRNIPNEERDASAAAIAASALLELSQYSNNGKTYINASKQMLASLSSPTYLAKPGTNNNFILLHSVGHKPGKSEVNVPLIYADYYYIEALMRYKKLSKPPLSR